MQRSMFNVQVPVADGNEVFLMNTFSDAQILVSSDVPQLMDRVSRGDAGFTDEERETLEALVENGFLVESRTDERAALDKYFRDLREDTEQLRVTVLTTLQCNFACDYCFQGDHGDYNKFAEKMSLETAQKVVAWIEQRMDEVKPAKFVLTLFGGEPLLNLPVAYYLAEQCHALCAGARHRPGPQRHHQRPAADARGGRSPQPVRSLRRQDHARRRPRHAQPDASASRASGDVRQDRRERPPGGEQGADHHRRQLRRVVGRQLSGAARFPSRAGVRRQDRQDQLQADHQGAGCGHAEGHDSADRGRATAASR